MYDVTRVMTSAGRLSLRLSRGARAPLLLIHGNSMSADLFEGLIDSPLGRSYRMVAVDLPGHGRSEDAAVPETAYTFPGLADAMLDVLFALDMPEAMVLGWSLGGHVALEMMSRSARIPGAFIVAAPPVTPGPDAIGGFNITDALGLYMTEDLGAPQKRILAEMSTRTPAPECAYRAVERADGRARRIIAESVLAGVGADPRPLFENENRPIAVVMGERDTSPSRAFMSAVSGPAIWGGGVLQIADAGHAPFLDAPAAFNALLLDFLRSVGGGRRAPVEVTTPGARRLIA